MKRTSKAFTVTLMAIYTVILIFFFVVGYFVVDGLQIENRLDNEFAEIEYLINRDGITNTNIDIRLNNYVSEGEYLYVEMAIKDYFKDLLTECRKLNAIYEDLPLTTVLYLYNFDEDAPEFSYSKRVLSEKSNELEEIGNNLTYYFDENTIMSYAEKYNLSWYYVDYYKSMMIDDTIINENKEDIEQNIDYLLAMLDTYTDFFTFLSDNAEYWTMDEDYIYFDTDELLEEYNHYLDIINNMDFSSDFESFA